MLELLEEELLELSLPEDVDEDVVDSFAPEALAAGSLAWPGASEVLDAERLSLR